MNATREVGSYLTEGMRVPGVCWGVRVYMVNTVNRVSKIEDFPFAVMRGNIQITAIDSSAALCMYQANTWNYHVCWLDYETWTYTDLPGHIMSAAEPKACYTAGQIYMFRGATLHFPVSPGEHYLVTSKKWSILPSPHPYQLIHFVFPVKDDIYLLTLTENQLSFQVFTPNTSLFTEPIVLDDLETFYGGVYAQATDTILCVRKHRLWSWNLKTNQVKTEKTLKGDRGCSHGE